MKVIFCEECGGRNNVQDELLDQIEKQPISCQFCGNIMSKETIIPHKCLTKTINTLHYHLLFIDDDVFHLQLMKKTLEKEYTVSIASTGIHGLELAAARQPDLILLDLNMPGMDGYEVCKRLKENPVTRKIAVIFISARDREDDECRGFSLGAVDYVSKPINLQILTARIMVQLRIKQLLEQQKQQAESMIESLQQNSMAVEGEQERLRRENSGFSAILDSLPEKVLIEDGRQQISWANRAAAEQCGLPLAEMAGRPSREILELSGAACDECLPDAEHRRPGFLHLPLFDEDGTPAGAAHILLDDREHAAPLCQAAESAINSFMDQNRQAIKESLATILFGIDAIGSILRNNKEFETIGRPVMKAAEQLDQMICSLLEFERQNKDD